MENKFCYARPTDELHRGDCESREAAILEAISELKLRTGDVVSIGQSEPPDWEWWAPDADEIIDQLTCRADDNCGSEAADGWLYGVTKEEGDELTAGVREVVANWIRKHGYEPTFWEVENTEDVTITAEMVAKAEAVKVRIAE